jgi:BlaI family transcriptional regulator, penicillinase repressor
MSDPAQLSKRERQIMDAVWTLGQATVTHVMARMPDPPTRTAVRTLMTILERKGHLTHRKDGREFVYRPARPRGQAARCALGRVLATFFEGSLARAVAVRLMDRSDPLPPDELKRLTALIDDAKRKGR